jgi:uncharacterized protein YfaS (alpha-2-macroglobulin family)
VLEGLDNVFRMPHGCFEQTSSSVLVLDYLRRTEQARPEVEMKALNFINLGYQRLLSFEVEDGGFDWFGRPPAHPVLTAYALLEFADMARVHEIDPDLIPRTQNWLLREQQPDGTWPAPQRAGLEGTVDDLQGQTLRTTAYVTWAIAESLAGSPHERLSRALDRVAELTPARWQRTTC